MTNHQVKLWALSITGINCAVEMLELVFGDDALSISMFEAADGTSCDVEFIYNKKPDDAIILERMTELLKLEGMENASFTVKQIESRDWIIETLKSFTPITAGDFYIHGSHHKGALKAGKIPVLMDAGTAFGSGEHATTAACLEAICYLTKKGLLHHKNLNTLDVGTGSGVLAIALQKRIRTARLTAVDIDKTAVGFAAKYAKLNGIRSIPFAASDGYKCRLVKRNQPYNLIMANILARPLMRMASNLKTNLRPGGYAILSGLLESQERMALFPHRLLGLKLHKRIRKNGWIALILTL